MQKTIALKSSHAPSVISPTAVNERIAVVDILRGFALLGILLVNMGMFGAPVYQVLLGAGDAPAGADGIASWLIRFFAEGKFYSLFSLLFGFGLAMQMTRAEARGVNVVPLYLRRMLALLGIGLAHAVFFWIGDILVPYAVLGFVLLLFRNAKPRTLLIWACAMLLLIILINAGLVGLVELSKSVPDGAAMMEQAFAETKAQYAALNEAAVRAYGSGTFSEIMTQRLGDLAFMYSVTIFILPNILAMFLLGLYVGKRGILQNLPEHLPLVRRALIWGLILGVVGNLVFAFGSMFSERMEPSMVSLLSVAAQTIGAPALALAYASGLILLTQNPVWLHRLAPLGAAGRMALTNYLLQTIICTTIFYSYGLGLYGEVGAAAGIALALLIYLVQLPFSVWWLKRFRFGPVEWLWRSLTYGRWQAMRD